MRLVSIVTVDDAELSHSDFSELVRTGRNIIDFWVIVVRTTADEALVGARRLLDSRLATDAYMLVATEPCGVSKARNAGIRAFERSLKRTPGDVISFPDDDCSYPADFRENIYHALGRATGDVLLIPYGPSSSQVDRHRWPKARFQVISDLAPALVASAGIFLRAGEYKSIPVFDENLGVGTALQSAEDLEYILRQIGQGRLVSYDGFVHIEHAYKPSDPSRIIGNAACVLAFRKQFKRLKVVKTLGRLAIYVLRLSPESTKGGLLGPARTALSYGQLHGRTAVGGLLLNVGDPSLLAIEAARAADFESKTLVILAAHITSLNSRRSEAFVRAFNRADYAIADGVSLVLVSIFGKGTSVKKMATTDFAPLFLRQLSANISRPVTFAVVGGEGQTAFNAARCLETMIGGKCVYASHGFREDVSTVKREIEDSQPDVLIVGMGMPREAVWVDTHARDLGVKAVLTCGGWLRLLAGEESRSPKVLQTLQLEWLWRVATNPRRTFSRYAHGLVSIASSIRESRLR